MHLSSSFTALVGASVISVSSFNALAQRDPFTPGFSGTISLNAGYSQTQSQHNTHDDNAITHDLNNKGQQVSQVSPILLGRLQYSFGNTVIFLGNSEDQITEANFQAELGITQKLSRNSALTGALFGSVPGQDEVWRDPYLTGRARTVTDQAVSGVRFSWDLFSPVSVSLKYAYAQSEVDQDDIGLSALLSVAEQAQLARDSDYHRFGTEIAFPIGKALTIAPSMYYTRRDAKGNSHSFDEISGQVAVVINLPRHTFSTTFRNSIAEFSQDNPQFNRKQDYRSFGLFSVYSYHNLLNLPNTNLNLMAGYQITESDIEFYSSENLFLSTGVSYHF